MTSADLREVGYADNMDPLDYLDPTTRRSGLAEHWRSGNPIKRSGLAIAGSLVALGWMWFLLFGLLSGSGILLILSVIGVAAFAPKVWHSKAYVGLAGLAALYGWSIFFETDSRRTSAFFDMPTGRMVDTIAELFGVILLVGIIIAIVRLVLPRLPRAGVEKERPDLLSTSEAQDEVTDTLNDQEGVFAGRLEGQALYTSTQDRAVVLGPPGTGKTVFLVSQLLDWSESGRSFVVLDNKPEVLEITRGALEKRGYQICVFNPTSDKGDTYNLLDDVQSPEAIGELAATLIPSESAEDAVFNESARDFLDALITHGRAEGSISLPGVRDLLSKAGGFDQLARTIIEGPSAEASETMRTLLLTASNERLLGAVFATLLSNLRFLRYPAVSASLAKSDFSLSALCDDQPTALFLQFEEQHRDTTAQLLSTTINHVLRYLISHTDREPVLLLLDEIGSSPVIPNLTEKLNTIRSRQMPLWMYWQSLEQMQKYGKKAGEGANVILGACDMQMVFRLNDNASAEWMSQRIGVVDRLVKSTSTSLRQGNYLIPAETDTHSLVQEPKIFPHELQALETSEVICAYRGKAWRSEATPYFDREKC